MIIKGYTLQNEEKINRAIFGTVGREGKLEGGVGEKASEEQILVEYDLLGGLILKGAYKVKTGSFYDIAKKTARKEPEVILILQGINGQVEVAEDEDIPLEVKAVQIQAKAKEAKKGKKAKKSIEDEE
jgi:hypothetical protein